MKPYKLGLHKCAERVGLREVTPRWPACPGARAGPSPHLAHPQWPPRYLCPAPCTGTLQGDAPRMFSFSVRLHSIPQSSVHLQRGDADMEATCGRCHLQWLAARHRPWRDAAPPHHAASPCGQAAGRLPMRHLPVNAIQVLAEGPHLRC